MASKNCEKCFGLGTFTRLDSATGEDYVEKCSCRANWWEKEMTDDHEAEMAWEKRLGKRDQFKRKF